jgi:hypothetical protein
MSDTQVCPADAVATVRATLMADLATVEVTAKALDRSPRTIQRFIAQGRLPFVTIGRTPYVVVSQARETLLAASKPVGHAPVRRGRPPEGSLTGNPRRGRRTGDPKQDRKTAALSY